MSGDVRSRTIDELFRVLYMAMEFERGTRSYDTDVEISSTEIYMLKCIAETDKANVTLLAQMLDVSKSAISQAIKKLNAKGLITIATDEDNHSRYVIGLSDKGEVAHLSHISRRRSLNAKLKAVLDQYDDAACRQMTAFFAESKGILTDFL